MQLCRNKKKKNVCIIVLFVQKYEYSKLFKLPGPDMKTLGPEGGNFLASNYNVYNVKKLLKRMYMRIAWIYYVLLVKKYK